MRSGGNINIIQTQRLRFSAGRAVGPGCGGGIPNRLASGRGQFHHRNGPLSGAALCCTIPILACAPLKGRRNLSRLAPGFAFAARSAGQPFVTPDHHPTPCPEVHVNDLAHLSILKSIAARRERHPVSAT